MSDIIPTYMQPLVMEGLIYSQVLALAAYGADRDALSKAEHRKPTRKERKALAEGGGMPQRRDLDDGSLEHIRVRFNAAKAAMGDLHVLVGDVCGGASLAEVAHDHGYDTPHAIPPLLAWAARAIERAYAEPAVAA